MDERGLGTKSVNRLLWNLSFPAFVGMLAGSLYNIVDTIFIGHGAGMLAIGGLAISFPIMMFILAVSIMIGLGSASLLSISLGRKDYENADIIVGNALFLVAVFGISLTVVGTLFIDRILILFGSSPDILGYARDYMSIIFFGATFASFSMVTNNIVRSEGNAKTAMAAMLVSALSNIVLDAVFIFGFKMGVKGAAIATVISQFISFVYLSLYLFSNKTIIKLRPHHFRPQLSVIKNILTLGMPSFAYQIGMSILVIVINNVLKIYGGGMYISIYGVINRILSFLTMPIVGVMQGFSPIVGYNYGAKQMNRVLETYRKAILITTLMASLAFAVILTFPKILLGVFSTQDALVIFGSTPLRFVVAAYPVIGFQMVSARFFQATGKALPSLLLTMSRQLFFLIPAVLIFPLFLHINGVWLAFPFADIMSSLVTAVFTFFYFRKMGYKEKRGA